MAGKSWKDLKKKKPKQRAAAFDPGAFGKRSLPDLSALPGASPKLSKLMSERQALENNMQNLSAGGGQDLNPRDAARFQVPSMRERLEKQRIWEEKRAATSAKIEEQRAAARGGPQQTLDTIRAKKRANAPEVGRALPEAGTGERTGLNARRPRHAAVEPQVGTAPRSALNGRPSSKKSDFVRRAGKAKDWLTERDQQVESARDRIRSGLNKTPDLGALGGMKSKMDDFDRKLGDADRRMAAEGGMDAERDQLRELRKGNLGGGDGDLAKYSKMLDGPRKAVKKIDDNWTKKRDQIAGPMDKIGAYKDMIDRRLSTKTGGSGDLFERSHKARLAALKRLREKKEQEAKDEKRRKRALASQKERKANA